MEELIKKLFNKEVKANKATILKLANHGWIRVTTRLEGHRQYESVDFILYETGHGFAVSGATLNHIYSRLEKFSHSIDGVEKDARILPVMQSGERHVSKYRILPS